MAELRMLAKHCDFGDYLSTALRDQLVCGLFREAVHRKILAETDLTLDKAVEIARAAETARQETRQGSHPQQLSKQRLACKRRGSPTAAL
jgi:hypothetical protein